MSRKGKSLTVFAGVLVLGSLAVFARIRSNAADDEAAFQEQLRLARAEGIPTTAEELRALTTPAAPSENAAPFYRQLQGKWENIEIKRVTEEVVFLKTEAALKKGEQLLKRHRSELDLGDKATRLPRAWFNRDYSNGPATLFPELAKMQSLACLMLLRGSIAASKGDVAVAIANSRQSMSVGQHAGHDACALTHIVRYAICLQALKDLAYWSFAFRDPAYAKELERGIDAFPAPNPKEEHRADLFDALWLVDKGSTPEGRRDLGLTEQDVSPVENLMPALVSRSKAKIRLVQAERAYWEALDAPESARGPLLRKAQDNIDSAMAAFPTVANLMRMLSPRNDGEEDDGVTRRIRMYQSTREVMIAALRALRQPVIPASIQTDDLLSPFSSKPLSYRYNGRQMIISVDTSDAKPYQFKIPPDKVMERPTVKQ